MFKCYLCHSIDIINVIIMFNSHYCIFIFITDVISDIEY